MSELSVPSSLFTANMQAKNAAVMNQYKDLNTQMKAQTLDEKTLAKIDKAAKDYEAVFLSEMLSHMFEGVSFAGYGEEEKSAHSIYKSLLVQEYANSLSERGGIGLAKEIKANLIELQSASQPALPAKTETK